MRRVLTTILLLCGLLAGGLFGGGLPGAGRLGSSAWAATGGTGLRTVSYRGVTVRVPAGWPVFDLAASPATCVRFDRHAVYLGDPGARQTCPAAPVGRTEAILVAPGSLPAGVAGIGAGRVARVLHRARPTGRARPVATDRAENVTVLATWGDAPGVIERALGLGRRGLAAAQADANRRPAPARIAGVAAVSRGRSATTDPRHVMAATRATGATGATGATPGQIYTGKGFDACSAPSATTMSEWGASPYRAVGVYIGGANMACSQTNLTSTWVQGENAAGWHLIPIYVGLQAPESSCSDCAKLTKAKAASDGTIDAEDAVAQAQAIGLGTGNPIYDDMEAYTTGGSDTEAVLAFLQAWTEELHSLGYLSGIYSSDDSGVHDLANAPAGYVEPDDIWFANWNGEANTNDSELGSTQWIDHTRLHQYNGGEDETYDGATLDIDADDLDSATAAAGSAVPVASTPGAAPVAAGAPTITGAPLVGQVLTESHATWSNDPTSYAYQWETCSTTGTTGGGSIGPTCTPIAGATAPSLEVSAAEADTTITVAETATNAVGSGTPVVSTPTAAVSATPSSGYWLVSTAGNVLSSPGAHSYGSPVARRPRNVVGLAPLPSHRGYWVATETGTVYAYGKARRVSAKHVTAPVRAVVADPAGGVWLLTSTGTVLPLGGAAFYGSPAHSHIKDSQVVAMAPTPDGHGYWVVDSTGLIRAYGDATRLTAKKPPHPVIDAVAAPNGGLWLLTADGNLETLGGAVSFGSPATEHIAVTTITGMSPTADGGGYWLVDAAGQLFPFGDAATYPVPDHSGAIAGISGG